MEVVSDGKSWDQFSEDHVFQGVQKYLKDLGVEQEGVEEQRRRLQHHPKGKADSSTEEVEEDENEAQTSSEDPEKEQDKPHAECLTAHWEPQLGHYIVSIRRGSRVRTLHLLGACHRTPGVDYGDWIVFGEARPRQSEYTQFCRQCWPRGIAAENEDSGTESSSDELG